MDLTRRTLFASALAAPIAAAAAALQSSAKPGEPVEVSSLDDPAYARAIGRRPEPVDIEELRALASEMLPKFVSIGGQDQSKWTITIWLDNAFWPAYRAEVRRRFGVELPEGPLQRLEATVTDSPW